MSNTVQIDQVMLAIGEMKGTLGQVADQVATLSHVLLEGNGTPAITSQVATLNEKMENLEQLEERRRMPRSVTIPLVVSSLLSLAAVIVTLITIFR